MKHTHTHANKRNYLQTQAHQKVGVVYHFRDTYRLCVCVTVMHVVVYSIERWSESIKQLPVQ